MLVLSLDSAGSGCGVCVWRDGVVLAQADECMERGQDRRLLPMIVDVIKQAGVAFDALDRVAVTRGPGSFTGIRIGLAAARGIGLAASKPVIGLDRFAIFRAQIKTSTQPVFIIVQSKRAELFGRFYPVDAPPHEPSMMTADAIRVFLADKGAVILTGDTHIDSPYPFQPAIEPEVITCAALAAKADPTSPDCLPRPLYLRPPDVTIKAVVPGLCDA